MSKMIVNQKIGDFNTWKSSFDSMDPVRRKYGSTGATVFRGYSDPNDVVIISQWGNTDQARKFSQSPELKEAFKRAGLNGDSEFYFVE